MDKVQLYIYILIIIIIIHIVYDTFLTHPQIDHSHSHKCTLFSLFLDYNTQNQDYKT